MQNKTLDIDWGPLISEGLSNGATFAFGILWPYLLLCLGILVVRILFIVYFKKRKAKMKNSAVIGGVCPQCGNGLVEKNGKYGSFIGCSSFPKCRYAKND